MRLLWICLLALTAWPLFAQTAVSTEPPPADQDPQVFVKQGTALALKGDADGAVDAFNKALQLDPRDATAFEARGEAHIQQGELTDAITDFTKAVQIEPDLDTAFFHRGVAEESKGDFDTAISDFGETIQLKPQSTEAYVGRARAKYLKADLDGAIADVGEALLLSPNLAMAFFIRGLAQGDKGNNEQAADDFDQAARAGMPEAALWFWTAKTEGHQSQDLESQMSDLLAKASHPDPWISELGDFLLERTTDTQLLVDAQKGKRTEGRPAQAWFFIGISRSFSGDAKGAQDAFQQSLTVGDKNSYLAVEAHRQSKNPSPSP